MADGSIHAGLDQASIVRWTWPWANLATEAEQPKHGEDGPAAARRGGRSYAWLDSTACAARRWIISMADSTTEFCWPFRHTATRVN